MRQNPCIKFDISADLLKNFEPSSTIIQGAKMFVRQPKTVLAGSLIKNFMLTIKLVDTMKERNRNTPCFTYEVIKLTDNILEITIKTMEGSTIRNFGFQDVSLNDFPLVGKVRWI